MPFTFQNNKADFKLKQPLKLKAWLSKIILSEKKKEGKISYVFVSDEDLLKINREFLKHDTYTDIITFDYAEEKQLHAEIFISIDRLRENAEKLKIEFDSELRRVMVHGVLHLCGYKDKKKADKELMRKKESAALKRF
ncbi:MAG TPA: rRNA maturation RNase YbeY [Bacteroidia bacterium]|nr:rRNA maturation RNase YbeY [Bacteroidia bacterium]